MNGNQREPWHDDMEDDDRSMGVIVWVVGAALCALGAVLGYALS